MKISKLWQAIRNVLRELYRYTPSGLRSMEFDLGMERERRRLRERNRREKRDVL